MSKSAIQKSENEQMSNINNIGSKINQNINKSNSTPLNIQTKLQIGSPDDPLEKEADDMAEKVMRMPETNLIQRKCSECEEKEKINRKPLSSEISPFIQAKSINNSVASSDVTNQINSSRGKGSPLSSGTKGFMESRFGNDFSEVRIHTDSKANDLSTNLNAKAFTVGNDIFFNSGQYEPESGTGRRLLAHELTHVIQQNQSPQKIQREIFGENVRFDSLSGWPSRARLIGPLER